MSETQPEISVDGLVGELARAIAPQLRQPGTARDVVVEIFDRFAKHAGFAQPAGARWAAEILEAEGQMRAARGLRAIAACMRERQA